MGSLYMTRNNSFYEYKRKDKRANRPLRKNVTQKFLTRHNKVIVKRMKDTTIVITERLNHSVEKIPSTFEQVVDCSHNVCIMRNQCIKKD